MNESASIAPRDAAFACPHCGGYTISAFSKVRAFPMAPIRCGACGQFSCLPYLAHSVALGAVEFSFFIALMAGLAMRSWYVLLIPPIGVIAAVIILLQYFQLASFTNIWDKNHFSLLYPRVLCLLFIVCATVPYAMASLGI